MRCKNETKKGTYSVERHHQNNLTKKYIIPFFGTYRTRFYALKRSFVGGVRFMHKSKYQTLFFRSRRELPVA